MKIKLMELLKEAEALNAADAQKKAQVAKNRADMQQMSAKQRDLSKVRKNTNARTSKQQISKQMADIGSKKADLGVKTAQMMDDLQNESKLNENLTDDQYMDAMDELTMIHNAYEQEGNDCVRFDVRGGDFFRLWTSGELEGWNRVKRRLPSMDVRDTEKIIKKYKLRPN